MATMAIASHSSHHQNHTHARPSSSLSSSAIASPAPAVLPTPLVLSPGVGVGPFRLGCSLGSVLDYVSLHGLHLGRNSLAFCSASPLSTDIVLTLLDLGVTLRFHPRDQRCHLIAISGFDRVALYYKKMLINPHSQAQGQPARSSPAAGLELHQLYHTFGPTFPGRHDDANHCYLLQYPGVCLVFPLDSPGGANQASLTSSSSSTPASGAAVAHARADLDLPLLANGCSPQLSRIFLHGHTNDSSSSSSASSGGNDVSNFRACIPPLSPSDAYFEPVLVLVGTGIVFPRRSAEAQLVGFDSYAQDLLTILGAPQNIYVKRKDVDDKMSIHRGAAGGSGGGGAGGGGVVSAGTSPASASRPFSGGGAGLGPGSATGSPSRPPSLMTSAASSLSPPPATADYFYNYFLHGLDFLLDGVSHRVKKIILHTNFVDRPDFGQYAKCNFTILRPGSELGSAAATAAAGASGRHMDHLELPPSNLSSGGGGGGGGAAGSHSASSSASATPSPQPPSSHSHARSLLGGGNMLGESSDFSLSLPADSAAASQPKGVKKGSKKSQGTSATDASSKPPSGSVAGGGSAQASPVGPTGVGASDFAQMRSFSPSLSPSVLPQSHATVVTADSQWCDVLSVFGPNLGRPMVSASSSSHSSSSAPVQAHAHSVPNPFGATYFYAYDGVVFEVMKNHHLASVTLFSTTTS